MEEQKSQEQTEAPGLVDVFNGYEGAPTKEEIEQLKVQHNEVFVSGFGPEDLYVWRALTRPEYRQLQELLQNPERPIDQFQYEELLCDMCVLWKADKRTWAEGKAGTPGTLSEQIMQNSNFLPPAAASVLVAKL